MAGGDALGTNAGAGRAADADGDVGDVGGNAGNADEGVGVTARADVDGGGTGDGVTTRAAGGGAIDGAGTAAPRGVPVGDTAVGEELPGSALLGPAIRVGCAGCTGSRGSTAVPRAAGIDDGREADAKPLRGAAGFGGAEGASIAITSDRPPNPSAIATTP